MKVENGNSLKVHYIGTLNDGTEFDNSYKRGEPIEFQVGSGQLIKGFDDGVLGMSQGEKKTINICRMTSIKQVCHDTKIFRQKFDRERAICHDSANARCCDNYCVRLFCGEKLKDCFSVEEI